MRSSPHRCPHRRLAIAFLGIVAVSFGGLGSQSAFGATRVTPTASNKPAPTTSPKAGSVTGVTVSAGPAKDVKSEVEARIVAAQRAAAPGLQVGPATCPKTLAVTRAQFPVGTFRCTVLIEGVVAPYQVVLSKGGGFKKGGTHLASAAAI